LAVSNRQHQRQRQKKSYQSPATGCQLNQIATATAEKPAIGIRQSALGQKKINTKKKEASSFRLPASSFQLPVSS